MQDFLHSNPGVLDWRSHEFQGVPGAGLKVRAFDVFVEFVDEVLCLIDVEADVSVGDPDLGVKERDIGGVPSDGVEDDLLVFEIVSPGVGAGLVQRAVV